MAGANANLNKAKKTQNDEFYTQIADVENELKHYVKHFKGKVVFCNCDDPTWSAFWKYFHLKFSVLGLKKLISTHFDKEKPTYKMEYEGGSDDDIETGVITPLECNGDFRSDECVALLDECDIVCTNPPFSIAREDFLPLLFEHNKQFLIIGDMNWVTYKYVFPLIKDNKMWLGYNNVKEFEQPDGSFKKFGNKLWFTNLDHDKRHEEIPLWKEYNPVDYPKYDNYDAINVNKVSEIPKDYFPSPDGGGGIGVPISFLTRYNPKQFRIRGIDRYLEDNPQYGKRFNINGHETYARIVIERIA